MRDSNTHLNHLHLLESFESFYAFSGGKQKLLDNIMGCNVIINVLCKNVTFLKRNELERDQKKRISLYLTNNV